MKKNRLMRYLPLLVLLLSMAACQKKEYTQWIPKDAALVVVADPAHLIEEAGGEAALKELAGKTDHILLKSIASAPEETGVDVTAKAYLFASLNRDEPTLLMKLKDADLLEIWLEKMQAKGLCDKLQNRGDLSWTFFTEQGYCVFTKEAVMWVYAPLTPPETVLNRLSQLMKQEPEESFLATEPYKRLEEMKGSMAFYLSLSTLPNAAEVSSMLGLPFSLSAEDIRVLGTVTLSKAKASLQAQYYSEKKELADFLDRQSMDMHSLSSRFFDYIPQDVMACIALKLEGNGYSKVGQLPGVGALIENLSRFSGIDSERFLDSFHGDFVFALGAIPTEGIPPLVCYAQTADNGTRLMLKDGIAQASDFFGPAIKTLAPDNYQISMRGVGALYLGMKQKDFYMLSGSTNPLTPVQNPLSKSALEGMKGKLISYILINTDRIGDAESIAQEYMGDKVSLLQQIRTVELAVRPANRLELNIYFR